MLRNNILINNYFGRKTVIFFSYVINIINVIIWNYIALTHVQFVRLAITNILRFI
jgi:hypothetical protein